MRLPERKTTTSPGTRSRAGTSHSSRSRKTVAVGAAMRRSASMARSARYSWTKPRMIAKRTITVIAMASTPWPRKRGQRRRKEQDDDQHILELLEEDHPRRDRVGGLQFVRTVLEQALRGFRSGQPGGGGLKAGTHLGSGESVPRWDRCLCERRLHAELIPGGGSDRPRTRIDSSRSFDSAPRGVARVLPKADGTSTRF